MGIKETWKQNWSLKKKTQNQNLPGFLFAVQSNTRLPTIDDATHFSCLDRFELRHHPRVRLSHAEVVFLLLSPAVYLNVEKRPATS